MIDTILISRSVAQWTNLAAVRTHLKLGTLELIDPLTSMHTKAGETFVYRLKIPSLDTLRSLVESSYEANASLIHSVPPKVVWKSINEVSWWLTHKVEGSQTLELYEIRSTPKGDEVLISSGEF